MTPAPQPAAPDAPSEEAMRAAEIICPLVTENYANSIDKGAAQNENEAIRYEQRRCAKIIDEHFPRPSAPPNLNELADAVERVLTKWKELSREQRLATAPDFLGAMGGLMTAYARSGLVSKAQQGGMV